MYVLEFDLVFLLHFPIQEISRVSQVVDGCSSLLIRSCSIGTVTIDPPDTSLLSSPSLLFPVDVDSLDLYNTPFIQSRGGYQGILLAVDDLRFTHGQAIRSQILELGVPEENLVFDIRLVYSDVSFYDRSLDGLLTFFGASDYPSWWYGPPVLSHREVRVGMSANSFAISDQSRSAFSYTREECIVCFSRW